MRDEAMTVEQLIDALGRYPLAAQVQVLLMPDQPYSLFVTGTLSPSEYDLAHLFDEEAPQPDEGVVYLKTESRPRRSKK